MPLAVSDIAREVDSAFFWIGGVCILLLAGITAAMVYFIIRYRRRRNPRATQIEGNLPLELTWIIIPTIIVLFMFFKGYEGFKLMRDVPEDAMEVRVVGQRWFWTFIYPEHDVSSDRLFVPVNTPIRLTLRAPVADVVHSLYLPAFRVKEDVVPGKDNFMWFEAEREGTYNIFCAEYCGRDHSQMITELVVLAPGAFEEWIAKKVEDRHKPVVLEQALDPNSQEIQERGGAELYATYCKSCHGPQGRGGLVEGARDFTTLEGWTRSPKITDIYRTITEGVDGTQMRPFNHLSQWDRFALAHQVASFYKGGERPQPAEEEIQALVEQYRLGEREERGETISIEEAMRAIAAEAARSSDQER